MAYDLDSLINILQQLRASGELSLKPVNANLSSRGKKIDFSKGTLLEYASVQDYDFQDSLCAHIQCVDPIYEGNDFTSLTNNPFLGAFNAPNTPNNTVKQSIECVLEIEYGTEGEQFFCKANAPVGQSVKIPFVGSYLKVGSLLQPRYWPRLDIGGAGGPFGFISTNDLTRNNIWNSPRDPDNDLRQNLPTTLITSLTNNPVTVNSLLARGAASLGQGASYDFGSRLTRRFFGTVPQGAVGVASRVLCPITKNSGTVQLICDQSTTVFGDIQPSGTLAMGFRLYNGQEIYNFAEIPAAGSFKPNQRVTVPSDAIAVLVYAQAATVRETPFELAWDLGF